MKPSTYAEENRRRDELLGLCRSAGLEVDYCIITWAGEAPNHPEGRVSFKFGGNELTFEMLAAAGRLLGTTKIDIACEHGCESDRCHDTFITFRGAKGL
jgi:hypothetical protein